MPELTWIKFRSYSQPYRKRVLKKLLEKWGMWPFPSCGYCGSKAVIKFEENEYHGGEFSVVCGSAEGCQEGHYDPYYNCYEHDSDYIVAFQADQALYVAVSMWFNAQNGYKYYREYWLSEQARFGRDLRHKLARLDDCVSDIMQLVDKEDEENQAGTS